MRGPQSVAPQSDERAGTLSRNGFIAKGEPATVPTHVREAVGSGGESLDLATRTFMESRFGHDFSSVRVHPNGRAASSARQLRAAAYTLGENVVFGSGQYSPHTASGRWLLAHELTHVLQQRRSSSGGGHHAGGTVGYGVVQRFESYEHVELGGEESGSRTGFILLECHRRDLAQHASPVASWPAAWQKYFLTLDDKQRRALKQGLTYGEVVALVGDMYVDFDALNRAPLREVIDLVALMRNTSAKTEDLQAATGGRYLALAQENIVHFSNVPAGLRNRDAWRRNHVAAIEAARAGNANAAWGLNAAGDHYLTDAFSAGHVRTPRHALHKQGKPGDIASKAFHDLDNKFGVKVKNARGDAWDAYGDGNLNEVTNQRKKDSALEAKQRNKAFALEAVELSKRDVEEALSQGVRYPAPTAQTKFAAEQLIPTPERATVNRWSERDIASELAHLAAEEGPGIAANLTGDDDRVRDWINRHETSALGRQSEADITRMLQTLLSEWGVVTDDDMRAIERLLGSVRDVAMMARLRAAFAPRAIDIGDFGLRTRFRVALSRDP